MDRTMSIHHPDIVASTKAYDHWLVSLEPSFAHDLARKTTWMDTSTSDFLRATFYRWSERFPVICSVANDAAGVRAVGDVHVGNFGTWYDKDKRFRWGVNDFDEAAWMPFTNDLVRLATSALIARTDLNPGHVGERILAGYKSRVVEGHPNILEVTNHSDLARALDAMRKRPDRFYTDLAGKVQLDREEKQVLEELRAELHDRVAHGHLHHRAAGRGSLGRVRIFILREGDDPYALEAKRVLRSAWSWARAGGPDVPAPEDDDNVHLKKLLDDNRRRPDSQTDVVRKDGHQWVLRPLSPDNVGVDFTAIDAKFAAKLLEHMGSEVANVHLLSASKGQLASSLYDLTDDWLVSAAVAMRADTQADAFAWTGRDSQS
jgi:Uncharacterized protein conserved in bacteria (DUF2252)